MEDSTAYSLANLAESARPARAGPRVDDISVPNEQFRLTRTHYRIGEMHQFKGAERLQKLLLAWRDGLHDDWLPREIDPWTLKTLGLLGDVHIVDTSAPTSDLWWFRLFGTGSNFYGGRDLTQSKVSDFDIQLYANATRDDYASVVYTALPRFQFVHTMTSLSISNRYRLILPLSLGGSTVDKLMVAWAYTRLHPVD